jgi:hypothetical protein
MGCNLQWQLAAMGCNVQWAAMGITAPRSEIEIGDKR